MAEDGVGGRQVLHGHDRLLGIIYEDLWNVLGTELALELHGLDLGSKGVEAVSVLGLGRRKK